VAARSLLTRSRTPRWHVGVFRGRRAGPPAIQEPLFEIELRPERRYFRQILQALTGALMGTDQLRAEVAVSRVLGVIWASDPERDGSTEEAFGRGLVDFARQQTQPVAANLLRALAVLATIREVREAAAAALAVRPWPAAPWDPPVGEVIVGRCWVAEDAFGDHATVLCEYGYGQDLRTAVRHGIAVHIDRVAQGAAVDVSLVDDVDAAELELRVGADHAKDEFRRVEPGWAGAVLEQALARTDLVPTAPVAPTFAPLRALALARARALPAASLDLVHSPTWPARSGSAWPSAGATDHREAIIAEFGRSPEAASLSAVPAATVAHVASLLLEFAARIDPADLLRVSPGRVEAFLEWLPAALRGKPDGAEPTASTQADSSVRSSEVTAVGLEVGPRDVAAVVRAWTAWAARQAGTPLLTRDLLAQAVDEILDDYLRAA
jgi:hypothetical protein